jgi:REP element-mobilizing transposase RayT
MPRHPRLFFPGATYHVYCRVARGEFVFDDPLEAEEFVSAVREVRDLHGWRIFAWTLMGNHYHLVIKTRTIPLWRSMLRLQSDVARKFNKRHRYLGRLWQSRYRARVIDSQDYFRQAVSYVHLNPVEAKIVADPADYPHCGHAEILGIEEPRLVDVRGVLRGFEDGLAGSQRERYLSWIRQVAELRWIDRGIRELPWWKDADNLDEIASPLRHPESRRFDNRPIEDDRVGMEVEDFTTLFEQHSGHTVEDLRSTLRRPLQVQARIKFATLAVTRYGMRSTEVARFLEKHPTTIARWINLGLRKQREDQSFRKLIDTLDSRISWSVRNNPTML